MSIGMYIVTISAILVVLFWVIPLALSTYFKYRGARVITCPETRAAAAVDVDVRQAVASSMLGQPDLRLRDCSRWPERQDCDQACLRQVEAAPEECLFRNLLGKWYLGKDCVFCGHSFSELHWSDHRPALLSPDNRIIYWHEIRPETLPDILATHAAVCWNCGVVEGFRRQHPDLVLDRPPRRDVHTYRT